MSVKIKNIDIIIALLFLAVFKSYAIPQTVQQTLKIVFLIIVLLYVLLNVPKNRWINIGFFLSIVYALPSFISYFNHTFTAKTFLEGLLYAICIYAIYMVIQLCVQKGMFDRLIYDLYILSAIYCVISLASIIIVGTSSSLSGTEMTYFFGNKFSTSYLFIMFASLYYIVPMKEGTASWRHNLNYLAICILAILVSIWIHCFTAVIGAVFLFVAVIIPDRMKKVIMSPLAIIVFIAIAGFIVFSISSILTIPQIQFFFYHIFGKSSGLTGRVYIYKNLTNIIQMRPIFGYGYNNAIVENIVGYGNAQNGLMELMVNFGCAGILCFFTTIYYCISCSDKNIRFYGLYIFIIVMIVCSVVEISYNYFFYLILFLIRWIPSD